MAKNLRIALLLDYYGELLTPKQQQVISFYYNDDLSLSEIAQNEGITRQGVRDAIKRGEEELRNFEEKLGMAARFAEFEAFSVRLETILASSEAETFSPHLRQTLTELCERLK